MKDSFPGFILDRFCTTSGALEALTSSDIETALSRHFRGDLGELSEDEIKANEEAPQDGSRLFSAYTSEGGTRFWIITERDRTVTTVLLPSED